MQISTHDERGWDAFRYVSGEMDETDRSAFELRLADDESLCDEVEQAVELNEAIRLSPPEPLDVRRSARESVRLRPAMWGAVLAASLLIGVFVVRALSIRSTQPDTAVPIAGAVPSGSPVGTDPGVESRGVEAGVSLVWADLSRRDADGLGADRWTEPEAVGEFSELDSALADPAGTMPPRWLLTAVAGGPKDAKETP